MSPDQQRHYNRERRTKARRTGLCLSCNERNDRVPLTKCSGCAKAHAAKKRRATA